MQFLIKSDKTWKIKEWSVPLILIFMVLFSSSCGIIFKKNDPLAEDKLPDDEAMMTNTAIQKEIRNLSTLPDSIGANLEEKDYQFVINELSYEIKRLGAEVNHLSKEMTSMKTKAEMLDNPLKIYNKEIILKNGSSMYGKIIFQDSKSIKIETLIGYLVIARKDIVRIIENYPDQPEEQAAITRNTPDSKMKAPVKAQASVATATALSSEAIPIPSINNENSSANCILVDNIKEIVDNSGNRIFKGVVKNIGTKRADFVKVNMVFRTNWSGGTKTITTFVKGSYHTYSSGISSDNALLPGATGNFSLVIPSSFGAFIGYTYNVNWESYD
ncbi:MAG: hypothetical protein KAI81_04120 [Candidatus Marinimicrobia bacterium]|nr:hypothetical protein [Candidatus Neomarinimicrobiota bacterium]